MNWLASTSNLRVTDILSLMGSIIVVILFLIGIYLLSRWVTKRMSIRSYGKHIKIMERVSLSPNMHLLIIEINKKYFLISASDKNIQLITELEGLDGFSETQNQAPVSFKNIFSDLLNKANMLRNPKGSADAANADDVDNGGVEDKKV